MKLGLAPVAVVALVMLGGCSSGTTSGGPVGGDASAFPTGPDEDGGTTSLDASTDGASASDAAEGGGQPKPTPTKALCDRVVNECKNTYYEDAADCVKQSLDYWGSCPARITALDTYSACIGKLPCSTIGGSYNPSSTPCASLYNDLKATKCN